MEEEQLNPQGAMCITCLSTDRNLTSIKIMSDVYQILNLLIQTQHYEVCNIELQLCWECLSLVQRFDRFKKQAHLAQQYLYGFNDVVKVEDPLAVPTSLSTLICTKADFDDIFGDLSNNSQPLIPNVHTPIVKQERVDISDISIQGHSKQDCRKDNTVKNKQINIPAKPVHSSHAVQSAESVTNLSNVKVNVTAGSTVNTVKSDKIKPLSTIKTETVTKPKKSVKFTFSSVGEPEKRVGMKPITTPILNKEEEPNCSKSLDDIPDGSETDTASSDGFEEANVFEPERSKETEPVYGYYYPCYECGKLYKSENGRWYHMQSKHKENVQCDYCNNTFVNKNTLIAHIKVKHQGPLPKEECPICRRMVVTIRLKRHIKLQHTDKKPVNTIRHTCDLCNKNFFTKTGYNDHMKYSKAHRKPENYQFPCSKCDRGFVTELALEDHVNFSHLGQTKHKCNTCEKPYSCQRSLLKHIRNKHGNKPKEKPRDQVCHTCGKAFNCKKTLSDHMLTHSDERPYVCDICQDTFKQSGALYTHRKLKHKVPAKRKNIKIIDADT